jgi:hypothetical protein
LALQVLRANKLFKVTGAGNTNTGHVIRHLKKKHLVSFRRGREEEDEEEEDEEEEDEEEEDEEEEDEEDNTPPITTPSISAGGTIPGLFANMSTTTNHVAREGFKALVSVIDADKFRWMLIKWIVSMHIALSVIENKHFCELLITIAPVLKPLGFPFKRCGKARFQVYFSEAGGFRVEDQVLSFPFGGNSERLQGLLGRRRPPWDSFH